MFYYEYDDTWAIYCDICDKNAIDKLYNFDLKSKSHTNKFSKRQRLQKIQIFKIIYFQ